MCMRMCCARAGKTWQLQNPLLFALHAHGLCLDSGAGEGGRANMRGFGSCWVRGSGADATVTDLTCQAHLNNHSNPSFGSHAPAWGAPLLARKWNEHARAA
eukprot:15485875-Alexandrium_andersonii.AAC.2